MASEPRAKPTGDVWEKAYSDPAGAARALENHAWLATLEPLRLPRLLAVVGLQLRFERLDGAHATPDDLVRIAAHLGEVHATAHQRSLRRASLGEDFTTPLPQGRRHRIPSFWAGRRGAVVRTLSSGAVPEPLFSASEADALMKAAAGQPVTFYKDSNPRNFLVSARSARSAPATIDFDDLTLAPFGYDLAKLVVGLAMTNGRLPDDLIVSALTAYNTAVRSREPGLPPVSTGNFLTWTEIHHVLTSRYRGRGGYRYGWHRVRPRALGPALSGPSVPASSITSEQGS